MESLRVFHWRQIQEISGKCFLLLDSCAWSTCFLPLSAAVISIFQHYKNLGPVGTQTSMNVAVNSEVRCPPSSTTHSKQTRMPTGDFLDPMRRVVCLPGIGYLAYPPGLLKFGEGLSFYLPLISDPNKCLYNVRFPILTLSHRCQYSNMPNIFTAFSFLFSDGSCEEKILLQVYSQTQGL